MEWNNLDWIYKLFSNLLENNVNSQLLHFPPSVYFFLKPFVVNNSSLESLWATVAIYPYLLFRVVCCLYFVSSVLSCPHLCLCLFSSLYTCFFIFYGEFENKHALLLEILGKIKWEWVAEIVRGALPWMWRVSLWIRAVRIAVWWLMSCKLLLAPPFPQLTQSVLQGTVLQGTSRPDS